MSEPKLISPLLDGFSLGNPMSSHDGVRCYPALKENSENKYIVKIISVPASQVQLDALLLTGAYKDPADAMDYFKDVADGVSNEAGILTKLSKLEGFLPYDSWQIVPMEDGRLGYEVYLISSYKRSLDKFMRRNALTHLDAVNLGLDLCQALAICRRAGYLYVDLKPSNIFISREREYRIGDLGFAALDSLEYTSLPGKYISPYSAPETKDALKTLNDTVDTYAVGMILYQIFNDGALPSKPLEPTDPFPTPVNADYEIAEIILKALSPDPKDRWKDPMAMGQALVAYMQRNSINKTPIAPQGALNTEGVALETVEKAEEFGAQKTEAEAVEAVLPVETEDTLPDEAVPADSADTPAEDDTKQAEADSDAADAAEQEMPSPVEAAVGMIPDIPDLPPALAEPEDQIPELILEENVPAPPVDTTLLLTETAEEEDGIPETISLPDPEPLVIEEPPLRLAFPDMMEPDQEDVELFTLNKEPAVPKPFVSEEPSIPLKTITPPERRKRSTVSTGWVAPLVTLLVLGLLAFGGFWYYQNYYLQTIDDLTIDGSMNSLTVTVDTDVDHSLLSVICTDSYGNATTKPLADGKAVFWELLPNSQYKIQLEIAGFHKLVGKTMDMFNTEALTNIVSFTAGIGPEDGSVVLTMTVEGGEPDEWLLTYSAEGEDIKNTAFSGHSVTVKELTVGKTYTFQLGTRDGLPMNGITELEYTAAKIIMAENLHVTSINDGSMTVRWNSAEDIVVDSWFVRCYDENGVEQTQEVTSNAATFTNIDPAQSYTVEVTASGMTQPSRTTITANPITITNFQVNDESPNSLTLTWEFDGKEPEGGWLLMYSFSGSDKQSVVKCEDATAVISPKIPSAGYRFTIQAADSTSIFGGEQSYSAPNPDIFFEQGLSAQNITGHLLKTPEGEWSFESEGKDSFSSTFSAGDKLSLVLHANINFYLRDQDISVLYVFRDENDAVISDLIAHDSINWKDFWYEGDYHYGELDIPTAPEDPGEYSLSLYFNNAAVIYITFTVQ